MGGEAADAAAAAVLCAPTGDLEAAGLLTGLFGNNIGSSRSPYLHQREADAQGLRLTYRLYDFEAFGLEAADLERMLAAAAALGFAGLNITYPFKQSITAARRATDNPRGRCGEYRPVQAGRMIGGYRQPRLCRSLRRGLPGARMAKSFSSARAGPARRPRMRCSSGDAKLVRSTWIGTGALSRTICAGTADRRSE
jgi:hypothetical protein